MTLMNPEWTFAEQVAVGATLWVWAAFSAYAFGRYFWLQCVIFKCDLDLEELDEMERELARIERAGKLRNPVVRMVKPGKYEWQEAELDEAG